MALDPKFQKFTTTSPVIASFNFQDIAEGTGSVVYYLIPSKDSSGNTHILSQAALYPRRMGNGFGSVAYVAFDSSPFNLPQTIKGTAYFTGEVNSADTTITAKLVHYDGTTETTIGAEVATAVLTATYTFNLAFDISRIDFAAGDILRVYVKTGHANHWISVDPTQTEPSGILPAKVSIPFELPQ